jgi:hypothetical protein
MATNRRGETPRAKDRDALQCKSKISLDSGILNLPWRLLLHYCNSPYAIVERHEQNPLRRLCFLSHKPTMRRQQCADNQPAGAGRMSEHCQIATARANGGTGVEDHFFLRSLCSLAAGVGDRRSGLIVSQWTAQGFPGIRDSNVFVGELPDPCCDEDGADCMGPVRTRPSSRASFDFTSFA